MISKLFSILFDADVYNYITIVIYISNYILATVKAMK